MAKAAVDLNFGSFYGKDEYSNRKPYTYSICFFFVIIYIKILALATKMLQSKKIQIKLPLEPLELLKLILSN